MDSTENKSKLGANATLAVSLACAKTAAKVLNIPLYRYIGGVNAHSLPVPMMNILNGGAHASNNIDIQEFMIMPLKAPTFSEGLRQCCEIYHTLGAILKSEKKIATVGDEGGFAPDLDSDEMAIEYIIKAIEQSGYTTDDIKIALDVASSEWYSDNFYTMPKRNVRMNTDDMIPNIFYDTIPNNINIPWSRIIVNNEMAILTEKEARKIHEVNKSQFSCSTFSGGITIPGNSVLEIFDTIQIVENDGETPIKINEGSNEESPLFFITGISHNYESSTKMWTTSLQLTYLDNTFIENKSVRDNWMSLTVLEETKQ
jgi:hypothetical protein